MCSIAAAVRKVISSALTHFVRVSPGCLCKVSNVGIGNCPRLVVTDKLSEILGGGVLVRVKPVLNNLDNLLHAKLLRRGSLELDNVLRKLNTN